MKFDKVIYSHRKRLKLSRKKLSEKSGLSVTSIQMIELGIRFPKYSSVIKLSNAFGLSTAQMYLEALSKDDFPDNIKHKFETFDQTRESIIKYLNEDEVS